MILNVENIPTGATGTNPCNEFDNKNTVVQNLLKRGYNLEFIRYQFEKLKDCSNPYIELNNIFKNYIPPKPLMKLSTFLSEEPKNIEYLVSPIIPRIGITMFIGLPKCGKTKFAEYVVTRGEQGKDVFKYHVPKPFKTDWFDEENGEPDMYTDFTCIRTSEGLSNDTSTTKLGIFRGLRLKEEFRTWLEYHIFNDKPDMVVIDSIAKVFEGDESSVKDVRKVFEILGPLANEYKICFLLIHHSTKDRLDARGSGEWRGMINSGIYFEKIPMQPEDNGGSRFMMIQKERRQGRDIKPINFLIRSDVDDDESVESGKIPTKREFIYLGYAKDVIQEKEDVKKVSCAQEMKESILKSKETKWTTEELYALVDNHKYKKNCRNDAINDILVNNVLARVGKRGKFEVIKYEF
jgi:hypothetical protein